MERPLDPGALHAETAARRCPRSGHGALAERSERPPGDDRGVVTPRAHAAAAVRRRTASSAWPEACRGPGAVVPLRPLDCVLALGALRAEAPRGLRGSFGR